LVISTTKDITLKTVWVSVGLLILFVFVLGVGSALASCPDGTTAGETLTCNDSSQTYFDGNNGNDTMTITNTGSPVFSSGDGDDAGGWSPGNGGDDSLTNNGTANGLFGDSSVGDGGNDTITNNGTVNGWVQGDRGGGNGGNDTITNNGTINGAIYGEADLGGPIGGNDTITNNGTLNGTILAGGGDDRVVIRIGSTVTGLIRGEAGTDALEFTGIGGSPAELELGAAFAANCNATGHCAGTLTFGGKTYSFDTFEKLLGLVSQIQQGVVPSEGASLPTGPQLICDSLVKVFRLPNGDLEVYSGFDVMPNGWLIGVIPIGTIAQGQAFTNEGAPILDWDAVFNADGTISVFDANDVLVNSCRV
jgi:hypothetical protein